jgi:hypothetical protein
MPVVISGTNGVSGVDGTASNPSYEGTDSNTGIFFPAADTIAFAEGGTEVARFDSSGNFGVGTTANNGIRFTATGSASYGTVPNVAAAFRASDTAGAESALIIGSINGTDPFIGASGATGLGFRPLRFYTGDAERMRIDSSGNVGIGTSSPFAKLAVEQTGGNQIVARFNSSNAPAGIYTAATAGTSYFGFNLTHSSGNTFNYATTGLMYYIGDNAGVGALCFGVASGTAGTSAGTASTTNERMRIDSSGNLLVNTATTSGSGKVTVLSSTSTTWNGIAVTAAAASGNGAYPSYEFYNNSNAYRGRIAYDLPNTRLHVENNSAGGVYLSSGATSWTANSDERLKTDLVPIEDAAQKVSTLRAVTGRYITDEEGVSRAFLIAQDVQAVLPEAVDATDTEKLGVAYTDTIPLLVAAIKEQQQMIETLQAKVAALEAK